MHFLTPDRRQTSGEGKAAVCSSTCPCSLRKAWSLPGTTVLSLSGIFFLGSEGLEGGEEPHEVLPNPLAVL